MTKPLPKSQKSKTVSILVIFIALALAVANIIASNAVATTGKNLQKLQTTANELEGKNNQLERRISEQKSFASLETAADELGLVPIDKTLSLIAPEPLAQAQ